MDKFAFVNAIFNGRFSAQRPTKGTIAYQAVFTMGLPGAGKSYIKEKRYLQHAGFVDIDADAIKQRHPDYNPDMPALLHEWSKNVADAEFKRVIQTGNPFIFDGTGTNTTLLINRMKKAKEAGYRIFVAFVFVPLEVSIFRNRNRNRFVPEDVILTKSKEIMVAFTRVKSFSDKVKIIQNYSTSELAAAKQDVMIYPPPRKIRPPRPGDADYGMAKAAMVHKVASLHLSRRHEKGFA